MTFRTLVVVAGLATLAGCSTPSEPRQHDNRGYPYDQRVYRDTDSYQGYYYVRIIYIGGDPWYVDEYRRVRPIPRHLHSHFQHSAWVRSLPPRFDREREMRDGYDISRIVYINDVPHYVDDDRRTRAVPDRLRSRFDYRVVVPQQGGDRRGDERRGDERHGDDRPQPSQRYDDRDARPVPPVHAREQERQEPPSNGRERERVTSPQSGADTMLRRTEEQERLRKERGDRQAPPVGRDGRSAPAGVEQNRGKGQIVTQPAKPTGDDRKTRAGITKYDEKRTDAAAEKKNGKARERGKDEQKTLDEGENRTGNARDARRGRGE